MKVISQIDEKTFVVRMDEYDSERTKSIFVAHDYFSVTTQGHVSLENPFHFKNGKFVEYGNLMVRQHCQIHIKEMIELVMPYLEAHPNMRPERLHDEDGKSTYSYTSGDLILHDEEKINKVDDKFLSTQVSRHYTRKAHADEYNVVETTNKAIFSAESWEELKPEKREYKFNPSEK